MKNKLELGFGLALCVTSGEGFKKGVIYSIVGWNNGINIARTDENGDVFIFLACNGGTGEGDLNNFNDSGSPSFREIKEAEERQQGEWISVSERLPDYMEDTLVTIQVNNREPKVRSGFFARGCFHNDNGDTWNWNDTEVKAWMPLPEAYKEADNEID